MCSGLCESCHTPLTRLFRVTRTPSILGINLLIGPAGGSVFEKIHPFSGTQPTGHCTHLVAVLLHVLLELLEASQLPPDLSWVTHK